MKPSVSASIDQGEATLTWRCFTIKLISLLFPYKSQKQKKHKQKRSQFKDVGTNIPLHPRKKNYKKKKENRNTTFPNN